MRKKIKKKIGGDIFKIDKKKVLEVRVSGIS
jgi:hypothetical protein